MLSALLPLLLAMMPVAIMTGPDLPSTIYYLALAASLGLLIQHRFAGAGDVTRQYRWLIAAVGAPWQWCCWPPPSMALWPVPTWKPGCASFWVCGWLCWRCRMFPIKSFGM